VQEEVLEMIGALPEHKHFAVSVFLDLDFCLGGRIPTGDADNATLVTVNKI